MKNVRFWDYVGYRNGYVKLTLKPGESIVHHGGGESDEGWAWWSNTYTYNEEEGIIELRMGANGSDCDGPYSSCQDMWCPIDRLDAREASEGPMKRPPSPKWERGEYFQRDYFAEAMGY